MSRTEASRVPVSVRGSSATRSRVLLSGALAALAVLTLGSAPAGGPASSVGGPAVPVRWAALGDSYTAGVFVGAPRPALGSPDRDGCDRTAGAYPNLVARGLAARPPGGRTVALTDVSCDGATIADITVHPQTPISPVRPPADGWAAVAPQVERAGLGPDTRVVTLGVGGNSLPPGMLVSCLTGGYGQPDDAAPCRDAYDTDGPVAGRESIRHAYERLVHEYTAMLNAVHREAPGAEVFTVGYPTIFPADPSGCDRADTSQFAARVSGLGLTSLTHGDIAWLHGVFARVNTILEAVTELHGDTYVDTAASSLGHDVCRPRGKKWVEGVCGRAGAYWPGELPLDARSTLECPGRSRATLLHPNAAGHANTATRVETALRARLTRPDLT